MGHSSQQINVSAHVAIWYLIAAVTVGAKPLSEKVSRTAFLMYILFLQLASAHHLLVEPGLSSEWKIVNTSYMMYLAVLGSMIHGMTVPGSIEAAQRKSGFTHGVFEWLRKAPWGNPAFAGMFLSLVMFGFLGGISGVVLGTEQLNIMMHNTLYVPGHFHAHGGGRNDAGLHGSHLSRRPTDLPARDHLAEAGTDTALSLRDRRSWHSLFMMGAGTLGVARRHWDITFPSSDVVLPYSYPPIASLMMGLNGLAAILAAAGVLSSSLLLLPAFCSARRWTRPMLWRPSAQCRRRSCKMRSASTEMPGLGIYLERMCL